MRTIHSEYPTLRAAEAAYNALIASGAISYAAHRPIIEWSDLERIYFLTVLG